MASERESEAQGLGAIYSKLGVSVPVAWIHLQLALVDEVPSCCTFSSDYDFISSEFKYDLKVKLGGGQDLNFSFHATLRVFNPSKGHFPTFAWMELL